MRLLSNLFTTAVILMTFCYANLAIAESGQSNQSPKKNVNPAVDNHDTMSDIEGVYLDANRSGFVVRAEGREDWKIYCNEVARLKKGHDEFARTVKNKDRVRFVGIRYNSNKAKMRVTHCVADSATILGSNQ